MLPLVVHPTSVASRYTFFFVEAQHLAFLEEVRSFRAADGRLILGAIPARQRKVHVSSHVNTRDSYRAKRPPHSGLQ